MVDAAVGRMALARAYYFSLLQGVGGTCTDTTCGDMGKGDSPKGLINATKSFAKILGPKGIVINAVAPGPVETDMLNVIPEDRKKAILNMVFTKRFARPKEVAKAIVWLATECPEYINGTCLDINNGAFPR